ncbi:MAG: Nucleic acid binding OB-fold tRNA/helicase-type, partial [Berkelbacteria bacterium GW2011_GWA1_36_9]
MRKAKYLLFIFFGLFLFLLGTQKTEAADSDVVINEVMANAPNDPLSHTEIYGLEWVELYNNGIVPVDLKNWTLDGKIISTSSLFLQPDNYLIIARDDILFKAQYPNVDCQIVKLGISLLNPSDEIILINADTINIYNEKFKWITDAGDNISWERIDPLMLVDDSNKHTSLVSGGTPCAKNSVSDLSVPLSPTLLSPQDNAEFVNVTTQEFNWQIQNNLKYEFILSKFSDFNDYVYDEPNLTVGKFLAEDLEPGIYYWKVIATNGLYETSSAVYSFKILPITYSNAIIINELYPDPTSGEEWIELYNNSAEDVNLKNWILEDLQGNSREVIEDLIIGKNSYGLILKTKSGITLNNDGDLIKLFNPNGELVSSTPEYSGGKKGWSFARNSAGVWQWTIKITPGLQNIISAPVVEDTVDDDEEDIPKNTVPIVVKTGEAKNHKDYLVKITGTVVETSGNTFYLDDGSGKVKVYIQVATGIDKPEMHTGDIFEITGIVNLYRDVWRILPQKQEDIKLIKAKKEEEQESVASSAKKSTAK